MTEESLSIRIGYSPVTMRFFLNGSLFIFALIIFLYFSGLYNLIPILFTIGCMMIEIRWKMRKQMALNLSATTSGITFGKDIVSWGDIRFFKSWGPIGIPFTPLRYRGISLYLENGKLIKLNSTYKGFEEILEMLEKKKVLESKIISSWHEYPSVVLRVFRYITTVLFCILYSLFFSFLLLIIPIIYFIYRRRKVSDKKENIAEDTWISIFTGAVLLIPAVLLLWYPLIAFLSCFIPVVIILWYPWIQKPICIHKDALFVGEKKAYPLRHLRSVRTISKFMVLKFQRLNFANGDVDIYPTLENFEKFRKHLEEQWDTIQQKYRGRNFTEEEALILSPEEEAVKIGFPPKDKTSIKENQPIEEQAISEKSEGSPEESNVE